MDVRYSVVPSEPFIQERVIGRQQFDEAAIFSKDAGNESLRFLTKSLAKVVIEVGEQTQVRRDRFEIP